VVISNRGTYLKNLNVPPLKKGFMLSHLWGRISTQKRLLLLGLISISSVVTFTAWILVSYTQNLKQPSINQYAFVVARAIAAGLTESFNSRSSKSSVQDYVQKQVQQSSAIAYIAFVNKENNSVVQAKSADDVYLPVFKGFKSGDETVFDSPKGKKQILSIGVPVTKDGLYVGMCWVGLNKEILAVFSNPEETKVFLLSIFGLVWFLGALCLAVNYALINRPLKALSSGASQIAAGRFGHQIPGQSAGREIDQVVSAFNYMSKRLQQYDKQNVDSLMGERNKYVSERNKLELVLMSIADGVVVCDRDNKVQIVNAAATQVFDKEAKDLLGKPLVFCTEGPDSPQICRVIQAFTDTLSPGSLGPVVQQIALGERTIRLHIAPISLNREFLGSVMIMHDITRQAELEKMKNEFISNVSHELRTPITSIKSYVDTLVTHGEKLEADTYREFLQIIDSEADRLMSLVNEVLELSKLEEGDRELEMVPQDIRQAVEYTIRAVHLMAKERNVDISFVSDNAVPVVQMNRESVERVVINLVSNALKYTPTGGKIELSVRHNKNTQEVEVAVKDNGIGIPEECLPHIFDRFFRVEKKVHTIKGTGLGLTIVKRIVEMHNGRITCESQIGQGSTFTIFLPVYVESDSAENNGQPDIETSGNQIANTKTNLVN
jgi:two-component system sensor histidine kinase NblS